MADPTPGSFTAGESTVQYAVSDGNFTPALVLGLDNATPPVLSLFIYVAGVPGFQKDLVTYDATGVAGTYKYDVVESTPGNFDVGGDLTVTGDSALTGTLDVTGATTLGTAGVTALTATNATVSSTLTMTAGTASSSVANSGTNTAYTLDTAVAMSGTTNLLKVSNHGTPKVTVAQDGVVTADAGLRSLAGYGNNASANTLGFGFSGSDAVVRGATIYLQGTGGAAVTSVTANGPVNAVTYNFPSSASFQIDTSGNDLRLASPTAGSTIVRSGQSGAHFAVINASGVEVDVVGQSFILKSPDGTRWKLAVADTTGALTAVLA